MPKTALIAGATGATAKRLVEVLASDPDWSVIGLSRNPPAAGGKTAFIRADMLDKADCARALKDASGVTHVFYTARAKHGEDTVEGVEDNTAMLRNVLDAIEPVARGLAHVCLVQGGKYYGQHLGPFPTPACEEDARHMPPNFYFNQQDLLIERQRGQKWSWSAVRPVCCSWRGVEELMAVQLAPLLSACEQSFCCLAHVQLLPIQQRWPVQCVVLCCILLCCTKLCYAVLCCSMPLQGPCAYCAA